MKTIRLLLAGALTTAAVSTSAYAGYYQLSHLDGLYNYVKLSEGETYSGTFDLTNKGFDPACEDVVWAKLAFAFADDALFGDFNYSGFWLGDPKEYAKVKYDGNVTWLGEVDGSIWNYDWVSITGSVGSLLVNALQDGILSYTVKLKHGDAYLKEVKLEACSVDVPCVPDNGSTVALLGLGLLGLAAVKRRKQQ